MATPSPKASKQAAAQRNQLFIRAYINADPSPKVSIDDLITDNLERAFEDCFGEFQSVPGKTSPGNHSPEEGDGHPALPRSIGEPGKTEQDASGNSLANDLDSLWTNLITDLNSIESTQTDDLVASLIQDERFLDAVKVRQGYELEIWPSSHRLLWNDLIELVPAASKVSFLKQFPEPPLKIAAVDLVAAAKVQAAAHDQLRQMIGLLPHDVETRQIYWIEMIKHVQSELSRSYCVIESVLTFCSKSYAKQGSHWQQASTCDRIQKFSQGLREMIRVLYRLDKSLPTLAAVKPSSPVFSLLNTALTSTSELQRWIRGKGSESESIVRAIMRNLIVEKGSVKMPDPVTKGQVCQICYLICEGKQGEYRHVSKSWIVYDDVVMHSTCANLFVRSTMRDPSCLKLPSFTG